MSIFVQNFILDQGADFSFVSQPYIIAGAIQNFTGATCRMMLRQNPGDVNPALSLTSTVGANGSVTQNGALGTVTVTIAKVATAALLPGVTYQYDVFVDMASGTSVRLLFGTMTISPSITH